LLSQRGGASQPLDDRSVLRRVTAAASAANLLAKTREARKNSHPFGIHLENSGPDDLGLPEVRSR
jgi:hypothetical protein